jgi:DNA polymerase-3 subunit alpha
MYKMFRGYPQVITNTVALADRIDNKDIDNHLFGGMRLPEFNIPEQYETPFEYLKALAIDGLKKMGWDKSKPHVDALKKELIDVKVALDNNNYDFSTYFLIVRDYIQASRAKGILVGCGRGSGYASVLLRCIDITYGVDPLAYDLIWERFLGFDSKRFIREADLGFEEEIEIKIKEEDELDEEREVEDDLGGVDRY